MFKVGKSSKFEKKILSTRKSAERSSVPGISGGGRADNDDMKCSWSMRTEQ